MALAPLFQGRLRLPIMAAPMFLVTGPDLVVECCRNGIACAMPALNARSTEGFKAWLSDIKQRLARAEDESGRAAAPFGINLIVHPTNPRLEADFMAVVEAQVPFIVTSLGAVRDLVHRIHSYGGIVLHDVINARHAAKAVEAGADGIIAVSAGAGGHAGSINPFALLAELKPVVGERMLVLSGSLSTGADVAAAYAAGADLAYMGTRFIATAESMAAPDYKDMVVRAGAGDIVYTPKISGVNANFLRESLERAGLDVATLEPKAGMDLAHEAKAWSTIWSAGHGVAAISTCPTVAELVGDLERQFLAARERLSASGYSP